MSSDRLLSQILDPDEFYLAAAHFVLTINIIPRPSRLVYLFVCL